MNHANILIYVSSCLFFSTLLVEGYLGINWGRMATQRMIPSMVVDMVLQNNISEVKLYSASDNVVEAFGGTGINLAITMPNEEMKNMNRTEFTNTWIQVNIKRFMEKNVSFRYIYIGTQPLSPRFFNKTYENAVDVLRHMQETLKNEIDRGNTKVAGVKVSMAHYLDVLDTSITIPSKAEFREGIRADMVRLCEYLKSNNAPFGIDIFPLLTVQELFNNDTEFAFFENNSTSKFTDGKYTYNNVFEVMYDSVACALEKIGYPDMPITVAAIGWPTDGIENGNLKNAERFHQGLAKFVRSQTGTPRRPGTIDVYIHNFADENSVTKTAGPFMRHWGIYRFDGQPKFNLDFQGYERKIMPVSAIGITHMPKRWCILDISRISSNQSIPFRILDGYYNESCKFADCTAMSPGGSCSSLTFPLNYSYAFNVGFQTRDQAVQVNNSCNYGGYGVIVADDPSTPSCKFPVEILSAETTNYYGLGPSSPAFAIRPSSTSVTAILQFLFIFFTLACTC